MFAGFLSLSPATRPDAHVDQDAWRSALSPFHPPDREGFWQSGPAYLMEQRVFNAPANRDGQVPLVCPDTGAALAFWGRLDNRDTLAAALGLDPAPLTDTRLVLAAWRRWGSELPEHLLGDFALAVMDPERQHVFLARDPLGVKPLYYRLDSQCLAFATSVAALRVRRQFPLTPDPDWAARYLLRISMSHRQTGYREIVKLPPGHRLTVDATGREGLRRWHRWRDDPPAARRRDSRWVDGYRAVLEESIRCRMASAYPLATENSGGLDSATVTAYLARLLGTPGDRLHSLGFALCEREPARILATSQAGQIVHNYVVTALDSLDETDERIERALRVLGYPEEHGNASGHTLFYRECASRGIRTLFSGFGGDEAVTNQGHLLRWELLDQHQYAALWDLLPGRPLTRMFRLGRAALLGRAKPAYNPCWLAAWNARWPHQLLRADVVERLDLHTEYLGYARHDAPYRRVNAFVLHLLSQPYVATRLENGTLLAASYGIDYRWPLWDVRLVQQYLSTPGIEKAGPGGLGRYLHRRAIAGVVPDLITWKPGKDMGYGQFLRTIRARWLAKAAADARRLYADLHPLLDELIDRATLRTNTERAESGHADPEFVYSYRQGIRALLWLDNWLRSS